MTTCRECEKPVICRGLCEPHYRRALRIEKQRNAGVITTLDRLNELDWLTRGSVWVGEAARRCGWATLTAAEQVARRHNHPVLTTINHELYGRWRDHSR